MTTTSVERRRLMTIGVIRAFAVMIVVFVVYYLAPLDRMAGVPFWLSLPVGVLLLAAVTAYQVRAILRSLHPAVRGVEAVTVTVPLFLVLFAAAYVLVSASGRDNFSQGPLTRTDALYFTVTTFATVGFGDITPVSQFTRLLVTAQMILDLIILGAVIRLFLGAVQLARRERGASAPAEERS